MADLSYGSFTNSLNPHKGESIGAIPGYQFFRHLAYAKIPDSFTSQIPLRVPSRHPETPDKAFVLPTGHTPYQINWYLTAPGRTNPGAIMTWRISDTAAGTGPSSNMTVTPAGEVISNASNLANAFPGAPLFALPANNLLVNVPLSLFLTAPIKTDTFAQNAALRAEAKNALGKEYFILEVLTTKLGSPVGFTTLQPVLDEIVETTFKGM